MAKIQTAVSRLDGYGIQPSEISAKTYGPSTAAAILRFKKKRNIINRSYQTQADNIVGKMTIAALDQGMFTEENKARLRDNPSNWSATTALHSR